MPSTLLVAGLDARSLLLEAPLLQRERHLVDQRAYARDLLRDLMPMDARLVVLGTDIPDVSLVDAIRRIRASDATRHVSVLALIPSASAQGLEDDARDAGANAVLRRPLERAVLEGWLAKLLAVPRRVVARVPVQGQVVGTSKGPGAAHFCGLTQNISINGMLLASPVRLGDGSDLDLEFMVPGLAARLRALGRVVRPAPEVAWPYVGYGVEFLFVPPESLETLGRLVALGVSLTSTAPAQVQRHGIHSTVRRDEWIYEIHEPTAHDGLWQAEIRRAPREGWKPGHAGPFFVVAGPSADQALRQARDFVNRLS